MAEVGSKSVLFVCLEPFFGLLDDEVNMSRIIRSLSGLGLLVKKGFLLCQDYGNICRSPIAEAVFRKLVTDENVSANWRIDSAATSTYEVGNPPDYRGQNCMRKHGIPMNHTARQMDERECRGLVGLYLVSAPLQMDEYQKSKFMFRFYRDLNRKSNQVKNCKAKIELLGSYDPQKQLIIEDPYYGNDSDFEVVYQQCLRCCKAFLEKTH
ncbi:hypothetical protein U0070_024197 [Myodes glareolus]|uniref:Low molecular weight phosphotyrosine protein phosphatase n=1 Tax=Myodes glareolus TaxID=447135 RepID=A0AAW0IA16_MYOGA